MIKTNITKKQCNSLIDNTKIEYEPTAIINFCLNCKQEDCDGECEKFLDFKKIRGNKYV